MPLFFQPYWLDAVSAGKQWDVLIVADTDDSVLAAMPYVIERTLGMRYIETPPQTPLMGVWIRYDRQASPDTQRDVCMKLSEQLRELNLAWLSQQFPADSTLPLVWQHLDFKLKETSVFMLDTILDLDKTLDACSKNVKRQLQKALTLQAAYTTEPEDFFRFQQECFQLRKKTNPFSRESFLVLQKKTERTQQSAMLRIQNSNAETVAEAFLVWDNRVLYFLLPTLAPAYADSGAAALLVWETVKLAQQKALQLCFSPLSTKAFPFNYKQVGAKPHTASVIRKYYKGFFRVINFFRLLATIGK